MIQTSEISPCGDDVEKISEVFVIEKVPAEAGVDIRSAKFWQGGFDVLDKLVSALEKL